MSRSNGWTAGPKRPLVPQLTLMFVFLISNGLALNLADTFMSRSGQVEQTLAIPQLCGVIRSLVYDQTANIMLTR